LFEKDVSHWWSLIELQLGSGGLLKAAAFSHFLQKQLGVTRFNQLQIPLKIVAADFWNRNEVVFEKGHCTPELTINKPSYFETVFNAYQILQSSLIIEKLKNRQPHIYIRLDLQNIQVLDFNRVDEIFEQAKPARNKLRASLKSYQKD
jgi:NTE family protein